MLQGYRREEAILVFRGRLYNKERERMIICQAEGRTGEENGSGCYRIANASGHGRSRSSRRKILARSLRRTIMDVSSHGMQVPSGPGAGPPPPGGRGPARRVESSMTRAAAGPALRGTPAPRSIL